MFEFLAHDFPNTYYMDHIYSTFDTLFLSLLYTLEHTYIGQLNASYHAVYWSYVGIHLYMYT